MKVLILLLSLVSLSVFAQKENSQSRLPEDEAQARAFQKWDREEEEAREQEDEMRRINEERARGYQPQMKQTKKFPAQESPRE